ncbi:MAG: hypothetical protein AAF663_08630 [Planctomycetota bacterium]
MNGHELSTALQLMASFRHSACQAESGVGLEDEQGITMSAPALTLAETRAQNAAADFLEAYFQRATAELLKPQRDARHDDR